MRRDMGLDRIDLIRIQVWESTPESLWSLLLNDKSHWLNNSTKFIERKKLYQKTVSDHQTDSNWPYPPFKNIQKNLQKVTHLKKSTLVTRER